LDGQGIIERRRQAGITLVELLVVMAILAFAASLVVLNAPPSRALAKEEAERFAARTRAAWEDCVVKGATASITISDRDYRVERFVGGKWEPAQDARRFGERRVPDRVGMIAAVEDPAAKNEKPKEGEEEQPTRIILDPIGSTTPFRVEFRDGRERWIVRNLPDESILVERDGT
jgi:general secretion pathway protein H